MRKTNSKEVKQYFREYLNDILKECENMKELLEYIPKQYKAEVENIRKGEKVWNEYTKRWNTTIIVEWKDGTEDEYQNASYMRELLKDFGR